MASAEGGASDVSAESRAPCHHITLTETGASRSFQLPTEQKSEVDNTSYSPVESKPEQWEWSPSPPRSIVAHSSCLETQLDNDELELEPPLDEAQPNPTAQRLKNSAQRKRELELFEEVIARLQEDGLTFADWLVFVFDHERRSTTKTLRRLHFWRHEEQVLKLLDSFIHSQQTDSGRKLVQHWMIDRVTSKIHHEARRITQTGILRSSNKNVSISPTFLKQFRIGKIKETLQEHCPTSVKVLMAVAGVDQTRATFCEAPVSAQNIVLYCLIALLREFSQLNNLVQVVFSLYMYATGLQRQAFEILAHLGLLVSYSLLVSGLGTGTSSKGRPRKEVAESTGKTLSTAGPLKKLSDAAINEVRQVVAQGCPIGFVFDNINLLIRIAEAVLGRIDTPMNGTCATAFGIHGATDEALDQQAAMNAYKEAGPLELDDILLSPEEQSLHQQLMIHTMLRIIVEYGGSAFVGYLPLLEETQPKTQHLIELHKSETYPLAAMEIDEASIDGAIDVMNELYNAVHIDTTKEEFKRRIIFVGGDHKSVANLRAGRESRVGNDDPEHSFINVVFIMGLFHTVMSAVTGFLLLHFGRPTAGIHNPGSLHFHNKLLERKPFPTAPPIPFTESKNLIKVSLVARVLHCLTLESGFTSLEEYAESLRSTDALNNSNQATGANGEHLRKSWEQLVADVSRVYAVYTNIQRVESLRAARKFALPGEKEGDMVLENAILFLRDALNLEEIQRGIKRGDPGRVYLIIKVFALSCRGAGRTQYAHEFLNVIHHIEKVWPPLLRDLVLRNWLVNTTGHKDAWLPLDLHQEHDNLWIKTIYKARGSNTSWSWLAVISPCVEALRALAKDLNKMLGNYNGTHHTTPDLTLDIQKIMQSLKDHKVYQFDAGRTFEGEDNPVPDAESVGLSSLVNGGKSSPLAEYNESFCETQASRRQPVVSQMVSHTSLPRHASGSSSSHEGRQGAPANRESQNLVATERTRSIEPYRENIAANEVFEDQEGSSSEEELGVEESQSEPEADTEFILGDLTIEDEELGAMFFNSNESAEAAD